MKKNKKLFTFLISFFVFSFVFFGVAFAAGGLKEFIGRITDIIKDSIFALLFAVAFALFAYGVIEYLINPADESKRSKGKEYVLWGLVGLTIMFSVYGLIGILQNSFGLEDSDSIPIPQAPD